MAITYSVQAQPNLTGQGYQVLVVDYNDQNSIQHAVLGVDTVISTVTGPPELQLLEACVAQNVRRFAPAEFEGRPSVRPSTDPLDRGKKTILEWLQFYHSRIESTIFICGILYERFGPGGLAAHRLGLNTSLCNEGDYIVNCRTMTAEAPVYDNNNQARIYVCMIAAQDAARFITRAVDFSRWPREMTMTAERMTVNEITEAVIRVRGMFCSSTSACSTTNCQQVPRSPLLPGIVLPHYTTNCSLHKCMTTFRDRCEPKITSLRSTAATTSLRRVIFEMQTALGTSSLFASRHGLGASGQATFPSLSLSHNRLKLLCGI